MSDAAYVYYILAVEKLRLDALEISVSSPHRGVCIEHIYIYIYLGPRVRRCATRDARDAVLSFNLFYDSRAFFSIFMCTSACRSLWKCIFRCFLYDCAREARAGVDSDFGEYINDFMI